MTTMRSLLVVTFALSMAACSHKVRVTSQDFSTGIFVVCGKKGITGEELAAKAAEICPGGASVIKCGNQSYASSTAPASSGMVPASNSSAACCQYQCPVGAPGAPAPATPPPAATPTPAQ